MQITTDWFTDAGWVTAIGTVAGAVIAAIALIRKKTPKSLPTSAKEVATDIVGKLLQDRDHHVRQLTAKEQEIQELTRTIQALRDPDAPDRKRRAEAEAALARGDTKKAEQLFADLERLAVDKIQTADREASAQRKEAAAAARHRGALAFLHDTHGALAHYQRAAEYDPDDPIAWNRIGHLKRRLGELPEAQAAYQRVLAIGQQTNDQQTIAAALGNLGNVARIRGELDEAEQYHRQSLAIEQELGRKEGMASQLGNLGVVAKTRGELDQAEEYYWRSLAIEKELGRKEGMASDLSNLGNVVFIRGELDKAEEYYRQSLIIAKELGHKETIASILGNLGLIAKTRGELDQAEQYYRQALAIDRELGRKEGMASQLGNLGILAEARGQMEKAEARYREALTLFRAVGARPQVEQAARLLQRVQEKQGRKQAGR
uniref:Tfp pilus assembly protein PilF n=1 Tax=Candidatus Kentrum sp. MB TaxID=2138164 RepID=A0A451BG08_9GAMM|nr:MAG: Tfp pilus assembly protein PilF [Candidatus Kentron sp. MB]